MNRLVDMEAAHAREVCILVAGIVRIVIMLVSCVVWALVRIRVRRAHWLVTPMG